MALTAGFLRQTLHFSDVENAPKKKPSTLSFSYSRRLPKSGRNWRPFPLSSMKLLGCSIPIYRDLVGVRETDNGRTGMTAEQVLRCAILKQYRNLSYEELAFHLADSMTFRTFARLERKQRPSASTLQENIKSLSEETWEAINTAVITRASRDWNRERAHGSYRFHGGGV